MARFAAEEGKRLRGDHGRGAARCLSRYDWPGNVRQLENALFRAVVLADGDELTVAEFPQIAAQVDGFDVRIPPRRRRCPRPRWRRCREIVRASRRATRTSSPLVDDGNDVRKLEDLEAAVIRFALEHYRGQMSEVARKLGIGRSTLYRKLKDLGLEDQLAGAAA